ncbi:exo-alpha-sialidase [Enterococcus sp. BWR-S5]|uniref:exo-alpha-sialidase n=1 Tax=Enterococcus sp. BWR-S5 TaxID=2787714 RepID=UPI00192097ED|nr:exo-alpha-sialidase [Enterococcus sp. BWR-S5]MBL1224782.1 exo-alpha-sialidase [Enterococcus sp. BWR-S5]
MIYDEIWIDVNKFQSGYAIAARRNEEQAQIKIIVTNEGKKINNSAYTLKFVGNNPVGDLTNGTAARITGEEGAYLYTFTKENLAVSGKFKLAYFELYDSSNKKITSSDVQFRVIEEADMTADQATIHVTLLDEMLNKHDKELSSQKQEFDDYSNQQKDEWGNFVDSNREILESADPGGIILTELIDSRADTDGEVHKQLSSRLESDTLKTIEREKFKANSALVRKIQADTHNAFSDICWSERNKEYLLVFRGGERHVEGRNGEIYLSRSADGENWEEPELIITNSEYDLRDSSIIELTNGKLLLSLFLYSSSPKFGETWVYSSIDGGKTWQSPVKVTEEPLTFTTDKIVELNNKTLLIPTYQDVGGAIVTIFKSNDEGKTWQRLAYVGGSTGWNCSEPILYQLESGRLVCLIRTGNLSLPPEIKIAYSDDNGVTWSEVQTLTEGENVVRGHASGMIEHGDYLYTGLRYSTESWNWFGLVKIVKIDKETLTVVEQFVLDKAGHKDCGYTSFATNHVNDELLITYYINEQAFEGQVEIKVLKSNFSVFESETKAMIPNISTADLKAPHVLMDDKQGLAVLSLYQLNKLGRYLQMFDHNFQKAFEIGLTENTAGVSHVQLYTGAPESTLWLQPPGRNGGVKLIYGDNWLEINALGTTVFRKSIDSRSGANFYSASALRIPNNVSSGYVPLAVREAGTTEQRPEAVNTGYLYTDTTLNKLIQRIGSSWYDAMGNKV